MLAACSSNPAPTPAPTAAGVVVPYGEFADLQYFLLKGTNQVVIEFFDGSGTKIVDLDCQLQSNGPTFVLHVRILGNQTGPETKKFIWDTEGNAVYYFDVGNVDKSNLRVVYDDNKGPHDIPSAGTVDRPFEPEKSAAKSAPTSP